MTQAEIFQNMTKGEVADELRDIEMGIGALLAVISECEIKLPEDHPDPTAIPDCINLGKNAHASIKKLQMYWENKGINPESAPALHLAVMNLCDIVERHLPSYSASVQHAREALTASKL